MQILLYLVEQILVESLYVPALFREVHAYGMQVVEDVAENVLHHVGLPLRLVGKRIYNHFYTFFYK